MTRLEFLPDFHVDDSGPVLLRVDKIFLVVISGSFGRSSSSTLAIAVLRLSRDVASPGSEESKGLDCFTTATLGRKSYFNDMLLKLSWRAGNPQFAQMFDPKA